MRAFNLSLDDMSPNEKAGKYFESIEWCNRLIDTHPEIKINLFVPTRYARLNERPSRFKDNLDWVSALKDLPSDNYRINLHGLYHRRCVADYKWHKRPDSNNNEWELITYSQASRLLDTIEADFDEFDIKYDKVFRAPGWHIGLESIKLLLDRGYTIAGDKRYYNKFKKKVKNNKWVSYTWDLIGEPNAGDVYAFGHTSSWNNNFFNEDKYNAVRDLLGNDDFEFKFIK